MKITFQTHSNSLGGYLACYLFDINGNDIGFLGMRTKDLTFWNV